MKNIVYLAAMIAVFCSCEDFLDAYPEDKVSEESFWQSGNDVSKILTNIYANSFASSYERSPFWDEAMSDNAYNVWGWYGGAQAVANGTADAYGRVATQAWTASYANIRRCWQLLENIDKVASISSDTKSQFIGETRFFLAYNYFTLINYFENVPLVKKVLTIEESKELTQAAKSEVLDFILEQVDEASSLLNGKTQDFGRVTWGACQSLKTRILLYNERWQDVIKVTDGLSGKYQLNTAGDTPYYDLFSGDAENSPEIILSKPMDRSSGSVYTGHVVNQAFILKGISGGDPYRAIYPTGSLIDAYPMADGRLIREKGSSYDPRNPYKDRDPRLEQTVIYPTGQIKYLDAASNTIKETLYDPEDASTIAVQQYNASEPSATGYMWNKYVDWSPYAMNNILDCTNDIIIFRYAEVLISRAEALAEANGADSKDEICNLVDQLRTRVGGGLVHRENYTSKEDLITLVRNERRIELAGEGLRYWDILRWKVAELETARYFYGLKGELYGAYMRLDGVGKDSRIITVDGVPRKYVETRYFTAPKNYLSPIPQSEIDLNPSLQQNPGW
ncbi:MAG: RagB/SusD family nutrient uptake outer membrane protein [Tannerellaceae bacterium]|nr:RagB/SusD family nutrient uptake outer membrane protein [Tannerellaceae bacterium]